MKYQLTILTPSDNSYTYVGSDPDKLEVLVDKCICGEKKYLKLTRTGATTLIPKKVLMESIYFIHEIP